MSYAERLSRLGLTTLHTRRDRGDMIETFKIVTGKVDVEPSIWFTPLTNREGATSTRAASGHLNLARREAKYEGRQNQFSCRLVPRWDALTDQVKSQESLNNFKNAYDNHLQNYTIPF